MEAPSPPVEDPVADLEVLGIAGSLRAASYNRALLRAARELAPPGISLRSFEGLREIPPYDGDVEATGVPPPVVAFKQAVEAAGAVLIATPEYNYSIPGVLKNALDWCARPPGKSSFKGKVVAITGASTGAMATVRAQADLRRVLAAMGAIVVPAPEVLVAQADRKRDASGAYADEGTRKFLGMLLEELARWTVRFRG
jgi:chromate reductase